MVDEGGECGGCVCEARSAAKLLRGVIDESAG